MEANRRFLTRSPFPGPSLDETLRMLKPLAPTLEVLVLSCNKLGGTITDDIAAFTKLTKLDLFGMDLNGTFVDTRARSARATRRNRIGDFSRSPFPRCAGTIPESIGSLTNLESLGLAGNALSGA